MKRILLLPCITLTIAIAQAAELSASRWRFSVGPALRSDAEFSFSSENYSGASMIGNRVRAGYSGTPNQAGSLSPLDGHEYDDGYVRPDAGTPLDGNTWYWGYDNASQVQNGYLVFTGSDGRDTELGRSGSDFSSAHQGDDEAWGLQVQGACVLHRNGNLSAGMLAGLSAFRFSQKTSGSNFEYRQRWSIYDRFVQDRYDLNGITPPAAPYAHGPDGPTPANPLPAPVISATPERSAFRTLVGGGNYTAWNEYQQTLDLDLYAFSFGVFARYERERFHASVSAGPVINLVEADGSYHETLYGRSGSSSAVVLNEWRDRTSISEILVGGFAQAEAGYTLPERGIGLSVFARQDWIEELSSRTGPATWTADLEGPTFGLMLTLELR